MSELGEEACVPCRKGEPPATESERSELLAELPEWRLREIEGVRRLEREFRFKNFTAAMRFAVAVGRLADEQDHHPELLVAWGRVRVHWWTHAIGGLHRNDFVMAAKTDRVFDEEHAG